MKYDEYMDKECIPICNALNSLPGVMTTESCCGHCKEPYRIWFDTRDPYSLAVLARSVDRRYLPTVQLWDITLETREVRSDNMFCFRLASREPYADEKGMMSDVAKVMENVAYWSQDEFKEHFGKKEETCEGCVNFKGCVTCVDHNQKRTLG